MFASQFWPVKPVWQGGARGPVKPPHRAGQHASLPSPSLPRSTWALASSWLHPQHPTLDRELSLHGLPCDARCLTALGVHAPPFPLL